MYHANKRQTPEHYQRIIAIRIANTNQRYEAHFWERVRKTDKCWWWLTAKNKLGYGKVSYRGKLWKAHRVAWILANGPFDKKLWVLHKCDNPSCVRPDHLYLGGHAENTKDAVERKRFVSGENHPFYGKVGEQSPTSKYTNDQIKEIRAAYIPNVMGIGRLSKRFGISKTTISRIVTRKSWGHVE